jgi:hypothetical protein
VISTRLRQSSVLLALALKLRLQGEQLGKGRIRIGLALARRWTLGGGESAIPAPAATLVTVGTTVAALAFVAIPALRTWTPLGTRPRPARLAAFAAPVRGAAIVAAIIATRRRAALGWRCGRGLAGLPDLRLRLCAALRTALLVALGTAAMLMLSMRAPNLDELRLYGGRRLDRLGGFSRGSVGHDGFHSGWRIVDRRGVLDRRSLGGGFADDRLGFRSGCL